MGFRFDKKSNDPKHYCANTSILISQYEKWGSCSTGNKVCVSVAMDGIF